jgi:hypothetical protein
MPQRAEAAMHQAPYPYAVPRKLDPDLQRVLAYWNSLLRGAAEMPFWDDVKLIELPDLAGELMVLDVFEAPQRFRFAIVGDEVAALQEGAFEGKFLDEVTLQPPLAFLQSQCAATVESGRPTYYARGEDDGRLVLPLWGEGQIHMLLVAVA